MARLVLKQPANVNRDVAENAFWNGSDESLNADFTSLSILRSSTPKMMPTAIDPAQPKLKKLSPKRPGFSPGCRSLSMPTVDFVATPRTHFSRNPDALLGTNIAMPAM